MTYVDENRQKFIDAFIGVHGFFVREYLENVFNARSATSSRDLRAYRAGNANVAFDPAKGATVPLAGFRMVYFTSTPAARRFLTRITSVNRPYRIAEKHRGFKPVAEFVSDAPPPEPESLAELLADMTDAEKAQQIASVQNMIALITADCATGWTAERDYLLPLRIALAAMAGPAPHPIGVVQRGPQDGTGSYPAARVACTHDQADWDNFAEGTLLYLMAGNSPD